MARSASSQAGSTGATNSASSPLTDASRNSHDRECRPLLGTNPTGPDEDTAIRHEEEPNPKEPKRARPHQDLIGGDPQGREAQRQHDCLDHDRALTRQSTIP